VILLAPVSVLLGAVIGFGRGAAEGWSDVLRAWRQVNALARNEEDTGA
jgi:hypothetical protein